MNKLVMLGAVAVIGAGLVATKLFLLPDNPSVDAVQAGLGEVDLDDAGRSATRAAESVSDGVRSALTQPSPSLLTSDAIAQIAARSNGQVKRIGARAAALGRGQITAAQTAKRARSEQHFEEANRLHARDRASAAVKLWEQAAAMGHEGAALQLARVYLNGARGVLPDRNKAEHYMIKGVEFEHAPSVMLLAQLREGHHRSKRNAAEAARLYELAAELGDVDGAFHAGLLYRIGEGGALSADPPRAAGLFALAAQEGHAGAMQQLADMQMGAEGGLAPNPELTRKLLIESLRDEYVPATHSYARFLTARSSGAHRNMVDGYAWAAVAWKNDLPGAEELLRNLKPELSPAQIKAAQARAVAIAGSPE